MSQIPRLNKYAKADVWPLNPDGEILCMIMCEDVLAIDNLPRILSEVRGIGVVLIGEGDLSQNLGFPPQYEHPAVAEAMTAIRRICAEHDMPCGHPHIDAKNAARHIGKGYRLLIAAPTRGLRGSGRVPVAHGQNAGGRVIPMDVSPAAGDSALRSACSG